MSPVTRLLPPRARVAGAYTCRLAEATDAARVGGKAHNLARMLALGLAVPPGFVVTTRAFQAFLDAGRLADPIAGFLHGLDARDHPRVQAAARAIRALTLAAPVPDPVRAEVRRAREALLPGARLAVRSSAVGEDAAGASFAGQLDSCLDVASAEELDRALRTCWASYWSERSLSYQLSRQRRLDGMGVVVQAMVPAAVAGVLFTESPDPSPGGRDQLLGEYCLGLGDQLVAGRVTPGRFTIARADLRATVVTAPEQPPAAPGAGSPLDRAHLTALGRTGLRLEQALGGPQDVEWAIDGGGRLFFLQSRPITTAAGPPGVRWSNANVNENFPAPISPLLYSIATAGYYHYFRNLARVFGVSPRRIRAMDHPLRHIIGVHGGRMYYNLTSIHAVLRMAPFGDRLTQFFNHFVGAQQVAPPPRHAASWLDRGRLAQCGELAVIALRTAWQYLFLSRRVAAFERAVTEFAEGTRPAALEGRSLLALADDLRGFLDIRCHRWTNAALADAAAMVSGGLLERALHAAFPAAEHAALPSTLLKGLPDLVSNGPALALWALSRRIREDGALAAVFATLEPPEILGRLESEARFAGFRRELARFLEQWGFRCSGELMLTTPGFEENPAALLEILRSYARVDGESPAGALRRQARDRAVETAARLRTLALPRRVLLRRLLRWTHRAIALRERARLKQALLYSRCRRIGLALGDRLVAGGHLARREDVFFLTWEELDALASGSAMFPYHVSRLVELRRAEHAELSAMRPPDAMTIPEGTYLPPSTDGARESGPAGPAGELTGIAAGGGQVTARATVLGDTSEARRLAPGDVLVTRQTDPGWGPLFFLISGLVIERGGMLSHGAILAREFGIPSVVGVRDATGRIPSGATVAVDGDRGRVRLVD
jgi:pyruvate,water dikinase